MADSTGVYTPTFTLNYPGDTRDTIGQKVGPNRHGEYFIIDTAVFDGEKTHVTLQLVDQRQAFASESAR